MNILDKMAHMDCDFAAIRRETIGLTQSELAKKLGCSRAKVQRVEKEQAHYTPKELVSLANIVGVGLDALLKNKVVASMPKRKKTLDGIAPAWLKDYQKLAPHQRRLADAQLKSLINWMLKYN